MNKRFATSPVGSLKLALLVVLTFSSDYGIAQSQTREYLPGLPEISDNIDIELDNIFQFKLTEHGAGQSNQNAINTAVSEPLQLVGILIMGEKKRVWIKTHDSALLELEKGQRVPGSKLRIGQIFANSVALINVETCQNATTCEPMLTLELN